MRPAVFAPVLTQVPAEWFGTLNQLRHDCSNSDRPAALMVACSELGFQVDSVSGFQPGEFSFFQNFGNTIIPNDVRGADVSFDCCLQKEGILHVVVCGHLKCRSSRLCQHGETGVGVSAFTGAVAEGSAWVGMEYPGVSQQESARTAAFEGVLVQVRNIGTYPFAVDRIRCGRLKLHAWVLDDATRRVLIFSDGRFVDSSQLNSSRSSGGTT